MQMVQRNSRKEFPSNPQGCREIPTASLALQNVFLDSDALHSWLGTNDDKRPPAESSLFYSTVISK
jgi:hypothetical protein